VWERITTLRFRGQRHPPLVEGHGKKRYPKPKGLLVTADGGGSNGYRVRLWKIELQKLADELSSRSRCATCRLEPVNGNKSSIGFFLSSASLARQTPAQFSHNRRTDCRYDYRGGPDRTC